MGEWSYNYNIWGQLTLQTDARGAQVQFDYDLLGRVTERQAHLSGQTWDIVATYSYDTAPNGIGQLAGSTSPQAGVVDSVAYDLLGRLSLTRSGHFSGELASRKRTFTQSGATDACDQSSLSLTSRPALHVRNDSPSSPRERNCSSRSDTRAGCQCLYSR